MTKAIHQNSIEVKRIGRVIWVGKATKLKTYFTIKTIMKIGLEQLSNKLSENVLTNSMRI